METRVLLIETSTNSTSINCSEKIFKKIKKTILKRAQEKIKKHKVHVYSGKVGPLESSCSLNDQLCFTLLEEL